MAKKELLFSVTKKDLDVTYFRGSGAGGQHRNKTDTACRITHRDSGAVGVSQEFKSQEQNRRTAFKRLTESVKFKQWISLKTQEIINKETIEEKVEKMMAPENLKIEVKDDRGRWISAENNLDDSDN